MREFMPQKVYCTSVRQHRHASDLGIPLITVRERDVWRLASANARMSQADLKARIDAVRKTLGPPWTADHKIAAAAALVQA